MADECIGGVTCDKGGSDNYSGPDNTFDPYRDVPPGGCNGQKVVTWRVPLALQIVPALVLAAGMMYVSSSFIQTQLTHSDSSRSPPDG